HAVPKRRRPFSKKKSTKSADQTFGTPGTTETPGALRKRVGNGFNIEKFAIAAAHEDPAQQNASDQEHDYQTGLRTELRPQIIIRFEPLVMATYRFRALRLFAFSMTTTSASSPFNNNVLPTARRGRLRPRIRFCSRMRMAASSNVEASGPQHSSRARGERTAGTPV